MKKLFIIIILFSDFLFAQRVLSVDSVYTLSDSIKKIIKYENISELNNTNYNLWGFDLNVHENGFGIGSQFRMVKYYGLSTYFSLSINEAKDDKEVEYIDYWGQSYVPGKINRFFVVPLFANLEYRLFDQNLAKNLRPFVTAGLGVVSVYSSPYNLEIFSSLKKATPNLTYGLTVGGGANFGNEEKGFTGVNIKYSFIKLKKEIPSLETFDKTILYKSDFGGFMIQLTFAKVIN